MEQALKALNEISKEINLDKFYSISIYDDKIRLQGNKEENLFSVISNFCELNETEYGWIEGEFIYSNIIVGVILTGQ